MTPRCSADARARRASSSLSTRARRAAAAGLAVFAAQPAHAAATWTDWTSATTLGAMSANTVVGSLDLGGQAVQVTYRGATDAVQLAGADWWTAAGSPDPYGAFGAPDRHDIIRLVGGDPSTYMLTFSTAVLDPIVAFLSVGDGVRQVDYRFDHTPTLLTSGSGWWGGCAACLFVDGNTVSGREGQGLVQFNGLVTQLSWTAPNHEYWQGITVGARAGAVSVSPVPEPASAWLMASGLLAAGLVARRRRSA